MLTHEENEMLCRVGRDTPMGTMLRRYWIPAMLSNELIAGAAPQRVRLLGEDLVAFRSPDGRPGLVEEHCAHRGASLALARNEICGLRCLYHGWVTSADGSIAEMPPEPDEHGYRSRVRAVAYPVRERGGVVWTYLGPPEHEPPPLDFAWTDLPDDHRWLGKMRAECNWVQCLEGVIDSAHVNYLHHDSFEATPARSQSAFVQGGKISRPSLDGRPRIEVEDTPYGFRYAAIRRPVADADRLEYVRITPFVAPFYVLTPSSTSYTAMHIFVPIDDHHTMFYYAKTMHEPPADVEAFRREHAARSGMRPGVDFDADFRKFRSAENLWLQDRAAMENGASSSGIDGVTMQDFCITESMGRIYDRRKEHLGVSDVAVIHMRRVMIAAAKQLRECGEPPIGLKDRVDYGAIEAIDGLVPHETPWRELRKAQRV